jgi:hypothetical protein
MAQDSLILRFVVVLALAVSTINSEFTGAHKRKRESFLFTIGGLRRGSNPSGATQGH